jgi:hypothetical protein
MCHAKKEYHKTLVIVTSRKMVIEMITVMMVKKSDKNEKKR